MLIEFDPNKYINELQEAKFGQAEVNQFLKAREEGIAIPRNITDMDVIRKMRKVCKGKNFNVYQQKEILTGILKNVDVEKYTDKKYNRRQMEQIRLGLQKGLDVSIYANPTYSAEIMRHIRILMQSQPTAIVLFFVKYCKTLKEYDLEELRFALEEGVSTKHILSLEKISSSNLKRLRMSLKK